MIDYRMYSLLTAITATGFANGGAVAFSNIGARIVSAVFNYMVNRNMVFQSKENPVKSALKYFTLAVGILVGNTIMLEILVNAIGMNHYVGKLCTEFILFLCKLVYTKSFYLSKEGGIVCIDSKKHWWGMISSVILIAFTGYMLMDTFLLTKVYVVANDKKENKSDNDTENEQQEAVSTGTTYSDDNIQITLNRISGK